jgi:hypothetical protein
MFIQKRRGFLALAVGMLLIWPLSARAEVFEGPLFFTTFNGGQNVNKVQVTYDDGPKTLTLGPIMNIASTPGADGLVFTSDGFLAVGAQGNAAHRVNPNAVNSFTTVNAGGTSAFHMMVAPDGTIYSSGIPGKPATYNSTLTNNGTAHNTVTGSVSVLDTISWAGSDSNHGFYTSSGSGGFGSFGTIDLTNPANFVTSQKFGNLPAAHGMTHDPRTGDLILFGDGHITQIDPNNPTVIKSDLAIGGVNLDQGTVDGEGHVYVADNGGNLVFLDMRQSGLVNSPLNTLVVRFLASNLDDFAPKVGPGSNPVPEPSAMLLVGIAGLALLGYRWRSRLSVA